MLHCIHGLLIYLLRQCVLSMDYIKKTWIWKIFVALCKLRCANIKLPVYSRIFMYSTDICSLCNSNVLGDEYHYILICPFFKQGREIFIKPYFYTRPSILNFEILLGHQVKKQCQILRSLQLLFWNISEYNRRTTLFVSWRHKVHVYLCA